MEREGEVHNEAVYFAICSGCIGKKRLNFFFFFGRTKFTHAQYINIMYELDSTRQKLNSTFESVCRIMRQNQSNVRQKCDSRFRRRISVARGGTKV